MQRLCMDNMLVEGADAGFWDRLVPMHHLDIQTQEVNMDNAKHLQDKAQRHAGNQLSVRW